MSLDSMKEIFDRMEQEGKPFWEIVLETDMEERQVTRSQSLAKMLLTWQAMADAADNYTGRRRSVSGLVGGDGMKMRQYCFRGEAMSGGYISEVITEALSMAESNACMCRIVAAPTAGACGVMPAVLLPLCKYEKLTQHQILEALYDRLELKVITENIEDRATRLAVLKSKQECAFGQVSVTISMEELAEMQLEVAAILVPDAANELADDILCELRKAGVFVSDRKYLSYYPIAQAKAWLSGHSKVEPSDLLALKNYLWRLPADREKVENVLNRLCVNPMLDKVNNIRGMALGSQEVFDSTRGDGSNVDVGRKALIKLRGELIRLYQMQCELRAAAQSDSETAMVDALLDDLEKISRQAYEECGFTYTSLKEIAVLN